MITTTSLWWYAFGVATALVPSVVTVVILFVHLRRSPPARKSNDGDSVGHGQTWQCADCRQLFEVIVYPCPRCNSTKPRRLYRPSSARRIESDAPNEQRKAPG